MLYQFKLHFGASLNQLHNQYIWFFTNAKPTSEKRKKAVLPLH